MSQKPHASLKPVALDFLRRMSVPDDRIKCFEIIGTPIAFGFSPLTDEDKALFISEYQRVSDSCYVYSFVYDNLAIGFRNVSFLCISPYDEDRPYMLRIDRNNNLYVYAYVLNLDAPHLSEFGYVMLTNVNGGLARIG